ncbi:peptidase family C78-domain-containing protein [Aspergillus desertorum]
MDVQSGDDPTYPFCPFFDTDSNPVVAQHVQDRHPESESQTLSKESFGTKLSADLEDQLSTCSGEGDGNGHGSLGRLGHVRDVLNLRESAASRHASSPCKSQKESAKNRSEGLLSSQIGDRVEQRINTGKPPDKNIRKLGRAELGPYAHEKKMPSWLLRMLDKGNTTTKLSRITPNGRFSSLLVVENETPNVVPVLAQLCGQDKSVQRAFLCSTHVHHISKMPREGGFCGYRNIQMLVSYIQESRGPGSDHFPGALPTILQLQDLIERAWDMGYNTVGRTETGGVKGTRKFIGTSEAQALFLSLGIQCEARRIGKTKEMPAHSSLLSNVAAYFRDAGPLDDKTEKVVLTDLPPIYLQHQGHSMTIVGFEIREQGSANILVFDPSFKLLSAIKHAVGANIKSSEPARILKGFRKDVNYLQKYETFELLKYAPPMRTSPNIIITGTPGVGKTVHCEQLAQDTGLRHLSINKIAKDRGCYEAYDEELKTWVVDEDRLLDAIEDEVLQGGFLIDWHACDLFPKSWIDLVVVLRCPSTSTLYDRLNSRGYHETKLQENLDAEIFGVLVEEAREGFDEEIVVELNSEEDGDLEANCARIASWIEDWKSDQLKTSR